jgi:hypothetical protein
MAFGTARADRFPSDGGTSLSAKIAWVVTAVSLASGTASWISGFNPVYWTSGPAFSNDADTASFDTRFLQDYAPNSPSNYVPASSLILSTPPSELEKRLEQAKGLLAKKLPSHDARAAFIDEPKPSTVAAIPLPRSRPVEANLEMTNRPAMVQPEDRSLLQKLSDLLPAHLTLASLAPDGGLFRGGPDLASLGYDNLTAVYDISAHAVYLPDGSKLEAHSGRGNLMDDPGHASERNEGATPPNVYDLKPREAPFHGVQALRMIPVGDRSTLGRSGLLAHSYMLGPNGDSNGCVSIKNYEKFLAAFTKGEIKRLVVVPSLGDEVSALRRST